MRARTHGRQLALQYLFMADRLGWDGMPPFGVFATLVRAAERGPGDDDAFYAEALDFGEALAAGVAGRREGIDQALAGALQHYDLKRVAAVERAALRLACFELWRGEADRAVILDEAVELAKRFGGAESGGFVNGVAERLPPTSETTEEQA